MAIIYRMLPIIYVLIATGVLTYLFKRKFEVVLPVTLMAVTLLFWVMGILFSFHIGYAVLLLVIPLLILLLLYGWKKDRLNEFKYNYFTVGFFSFLFVAGLLAILNLRHGFQWWDEFSHWGPMVKEMLRLDDFYSTASSALSVHKDYPPMISLFETIWCKFSLKYQEAFVYNALHILTFSMFFPIFEKLEWKDGLKAVGKAVLCILLMFIFPLVIMGSAFYDRIYTDCILGILLGYGIYCIIIKEKSQIFNIFRLGITLSFLILTKQMGIAFYVLLVAFLIFTNTIVNFKKIFPLHKKNVTRSRICMSMGYIVAIGIPLLLFKIWNTYITKLQVGAQFRFGDIKLSNIWGIYKGTIGEAWQQEASINFIEAIASKPIGDMPIPLTYLEVGALVLLLLAVVGIYARKHISVLKTVCLGITAIAGAVGYAFAMWLLYVFCFGSYEGPRLASYDRYMSTYWYGIGVGVMLIYMYTANVKKKKMEYVYLITAIIIAAVCVGSRLATDLKPAIKYETTAWKYEIDADILTGYTGEEERIIVVSQNNNGEDVIHIRYLVLPRKIGSISLGHSYNDADVYSINLSKEEWDAMLRETNYLYLYSIDNQFRENYSYNFSENAKIENKKLFRVNVTVGNEIELVMVN